MVKPLLARGDAYPDSSDQSSLKPLSYAAESGLLYVSVVKGLLERGDVNPVSSDKSAHTRSRQGQTAHRGSSQNDLVTKAK